MQKYGHTVEVREQARRFAFAGEDEATGRTQVVFTMKVLDDIPISIHVVDRPAPILLGGDFLTKLGI
eukprot:4490451-Heterocapsa_arctica.AAC.1